MAPVAGEDEVRSIWRSRRDTEHLARRDQDPSHSRSPDKESATPITRSGLSDNLILTQESDPQAQRLLTLFEERGGKPFQVPWCCSVSTPSIPSIKPNHVWQRPTCLRTSEKNHV